MSDLIESRVDEMAAKIAVLEEEIAAIKKKLRGARRKSRKAAGLPVGKDKKKSAESSED